MIAPLDALIRANADRVRTLARICDTLLPRLTSDQLRLPVIDLDSAEAV